jgi:hypothetical protein
MAISFPGGSGNSLRLDTNLGTEESTIFFKYRIPSVPGADVVPLSIATRSGSTPYGPSEQAHYFLIEPDGATYNIAEKAYFDSPNGPIVSGIAPGTIVYFAISMYEASTRPAVKFSVKPQGGTFASVVRNEVWWTAGNNVFTWDNLTVWLGSQISSADGAAGLAFDCIIYGDIITDSGDIEQQMDAIGAEFSTPYWVTSFRNYASVALAVAKESGTATPTDWTVNGTLTVDNTYDGGGSEEETAQLGGGGVLAISDSGSAPSQVSGFSATTTTGSTVTLTWSAASGAVWYHIYGFKTATESDYDFYQSTNVAPPLVISNLEPRVEYQFVIVASNDSGDSPASTPITFTTGNLRLRLRARPTAAGKDGIRVSIHYPPATGRLIGEHIATFEDQEWETSTVVDPDGKTVAEMFIEIEGGTGSGAQEFPVGFADGDILEGYAEKDDGTEATWVMKDVEVQVS